MVVTFNATSTWTCPHGCVSVVVECFGAGGGSGVATTGEGSGGAGAYARKILPVTQGVVYTVSIGNGGSPGNAGGDTFFQTSSTILAKGGSAGVADAGGAPGLSSASIGDLTFSGGTGGSGTTGGGSKAGGGSAASGTSAGIGINGGNAVGNTPGQPADSTGRAGGASGLNGGNGIIRGASGAGGGNSGGNGGTGSSGQIVLTFTDRRILRC